MGKIIDEFVRTLPRLQARKIERELQTAVNRILYPSSTEFRDALQERLRALLESDSLIRFAPRELVQDEKRFSEVMDKMLKDIADDLSSMFAEADATLQTFNLQGSLYKDEILGRLRQSVREAEDEIERLELLRGNVSGLKDVIVNRFTSGGFRLARTAPEAAFVYIDPKMNVGIDSELDMPVGLNVGGLVLPTDLSETVRPSGIRDIVSSDVRDDADPLALPRAVNASTAGLRTSTTGDISNLIDRQNDTFWIKEIDVEESLAGGAKLNLQLDLGQSTTPINFIEIDPVANFSQELTEIYYADDLGSVHSIDLQTATVKLTEPVRIYFKPVTARQLTLVFTQRNAILHVNTSKYRFGLDNILVGKVKYHVAGYWVSNTLTLPKISKLFLRSKENTHVGVADAGQLSPVTNPLPTIEYWVSYRDLDASGNVVYSTYLPIAPSGVNSVTEELKLNDNDKGELNFSVDPNLAVADNDLLLYRNGLLLSRPLDYQFSSTAEVGRTVITVPNGYDGDDEYIAKYTPLHTNESAAPIPFIDTTKLIRYNSDNSIVIERPAASRAVRSEANLIIIMRGIGNGVQTSVVDEITFAVG